MGSDNGPHGLGRRGGGRALRLIGVGLLCLIFIGLGNSVQALTPEQTLAIAKGDSESRLAALNERIEAADGTVVPLLEALLADEIMLAGNQVLRVKGTEVTDAASGQAVVFPDNATEVINNNRMRREFEAALAAFRLVDADRGVRAQALTVLQDGVSEKLLPLLDKAAAQETDPVLKGRLAMAKAGALLASLDSQKRLAAAMLLADSPDPSTRSLLLQKISAETDPEVKAAMTASLQTVQSRLVWGERLGVLFAGASLGSILLLVALGLAITYGLMGVINMAHGELMMIGAYATWAVQNLFRTHLPGFFDAYILAAIPAAFLAAALVGALMERTVIRWLYGRPLETLLATWGISLILMQTVRSLFGAQNVGVENPSWLSGGLQVLPNLVLPYNRIAILIFAALVLAGVALLIAKTRLGLFVRGVTQNRRMAACMGVNTARVDTYAFALGAGIAGLAGCALSQIGNVGPDLGQSYIVDSFLVVVLGGVGQLAGTVWAALGLGILNKLLEGWQGAVLAKIMVLVLIVIVIQKRPQGLFALKGRSAET